MQEEVENKSVNLAVRTGSVSGRVLYQALRSFVQDQRSAVANRTARKESKERLKLAKMERKNAPKHGRQTVKQLIGQGQGVESMDIGDINDLLEQALIRKGFSNIKPVAILNDTVAVLLASAYTYPDTRIGSIYATGYNTCYMEVMPAVGRPACIINMESGAFSKMIPSKWDLELDRASEQPGRQRLEKMVSGKYIGELFSRLTKELLDLSTKPSFSTVDMSAIMEDRSVAAKILVDILGNVAEDEEIIEKLRNLAKAITIRSARIVAASWAGTLWHIAGSGRVEPQHIAVDGSLFQHMPYVQENVRRALYEILGDEAGGLEPVLVKDGSSIGAAIAAAVATCR